jgi:hypothetical protein
MTVPLAARWRSVALGGAEFSIPRSLDDSAAVATIRAGYDAGIRMFDSARVYARWMTGCTTCSMLALAACLLRCGARHFYSTSCVRCSMML